MGIDGFTTPGWLALLLPVAVVAGGYGYLQRRRLRYTMRFTNLELLERVAPRQPGWPRHVPPALLFVALLALTVALAGPTANTRVPRNRATVMLVLDVSLSMRATDVAPSRLAAAQDAATSFVRDLPPTINLGLESFAGTPAVLVPPGTDRQAAVAQIQVLKLAESTATGEALSTALTALDQFNSQVPGTEGGPPPAVIVLMSDGKQTVGRDEFAVAAAAGARHIPISTISFGTPYGSIDLDGQQVPVPVDDASLAQVAALSGGTFFPAQSNDQLHEVYDHLGQQIGYQTVHADVSKPWLAAGTLVSLLATALALTRAQRIPA